MGMLLGREMRKGGRPEVEKRARQRAVNMLMGIVSERNVTEGSDSMDAEKASQVGTREISA